MYVKSTNPHILGEASRGKKKWLTNDDVEFVRCVLIRADRENDGLSSKEAVDMIQELQPDLTREGA
jgi:translation initiation factor IF-3